MAEQPFHVQLRRSATRRTLLGLALVNVLFGGTTAAFIALWPTIADRGEGAQWVIRRLLVQGHLATENVVAAWYSSMLLLLTAVLALLAYRADGKSAASRLRFGWLAVAAGFAVLSVDELGSLHERLGMVDGLSPTGHAMGWVYLLAIPMAAAAALMTAFAWIHVRRVRASFWCLAAGVTLFLLNPLFELQEMALLRGGTPGSSQMRLHDLLLVVEESGLELFGILLFVAGITTYIHQTAGEIITLPRRISTRRAILGLVAILSAGSVVSVAVVDLLPAGDTGLPQNWFPAAAWMLTTLAVRTRPGFAALAAAISAAFGAGLYNYVGVLASSAPWHVPVAGIITAGLALEALVIYDNYRFSLSPMSSIASPTLRRPRPNPS